MHHIYCHNNLVIQGKYTILCLPAFLYPSQIESIRSIHFQWGCSVESEVNEYTKCGGEVWKQASRFLANLKNLEHLKIERHQQNSRYTTYYPHEGCLLRPLINLSHDKNIHVDMFSEGETRRTRLHEYFEIKPASIPNQDFPLRCTHPGCDGAEEDAETTMDWSL